MLESIGESTVRMTARVDQNNVAEDRNVALQKAEKLVEERPVEDTEQSTKPESDSEQKSGSYESDENGVYFEKYDKQGNVVFRAPPEQKPIDEHA